MATLYFSAYQSATSVAIGDPEQEGKIAVGGGSVQGAAITGNPGEVKWVRLVSDTACQFKHGTNPTADGDSQFLPANVVEYKWIKSGDLIAVIAQQ